MKTLILVEMLLLWFGTINHYMNKLDLSLPETVASVGVRTSIPTVILAFWLFLVADLGAPKVAALFGGIVAFSYLTGAVDAINDITDALLLESKPASDTETGADTTATAKKEATK